MNQSKGPEFIRFFRPILELLQESGGTGTPSEIVDRSLEIAKVSESEQDAVNKNGQSRVKNQVHWARQYLVWGDYLDSSKRGVWSLTDKGRSVDLTKLNPLEVFKSVQTRVTGTKQAKKQDTPSMDEPLPNDIDLQDHRTRLLASSVRHHPNKGLYKHEIVFGRYRSGREQTTPWINTL